MLVKNESGYVPLDRSRCRTSVTAYIITLRMSVGLKGEILSEIKPKVSDTERQVKIEHFSNID